MTSQAERGCRSIPPSPGQWAKQRPTLFFFHQLSFAARIDIPGYFSFR